MNSFNIFDSIIAYSLKIGSCVFATNAPIQNKKIRNVCNYLLDTIENVLFNAAIEYISPTASPPVITNCS